MSEQFVQNVEVFTQSSICIRGKKTIYFDPFQIQAEKHDGDIVFITHAHHDHYSPEDLKKVMKKNTILVYPRDLDSKVAELNLPKENRLAILPDQKFEVEGIRTETIPAYNIYKPFHPRHKKWVGYVLTLDGIRYYIAGDTDAVKEAATVKCDVAMVPIGGMYTMNAKEAAHLINTIKPQIAIPIHYGSIVGKIEDADLFRKNIDSSIKTVIKIRA